MNFFYCAPQVEQKHPDRNDSQKPPYFQVHWRYRADEIEN